MYYKMARDPEVGSEIIFERSSFKLLYSGLALEISECQDRHLETWGPVPTLPLTDYLGLRFITCERIIMKVYYWSQGKKKNWLRRSNLSLC